MSSRRDNCSLKLCIRALLTHLALLSFLLKELRLGLLHNEATASVKATVFVGTEQLHRWLSRTSTPMSCIPGG